jgi:hypothetical protein
MLDRASAPFPWLVDFPPVLPVQNLGSPFPRDQPTVQENTGSLDLDERHNRRQWFTARTKYADQAVVSCFEGEALVLARSCELVRQDAWPCPRLPCLFRTTDDLPVPCYVVSLGECHKGS